VPRSPVTRVLVVPESVNPGWVAHTADGAALTPVIVNGWQQGWVVPAGEQGAVTLSFPSNATYRTGLIAGLCLLPVLLAMALVFRRRPVREYLPAHPRAPGALAVAGLLGFGALIAGFAGVAVFACALAVGFLMRHRQPDFDRLALLTVAGGVILAGALLSRYPWRSVDGYIGHTPWVQLPALIALAALAASLVARPASAPREGSDAEEPAAS
jgi:arabinofuranan 3-O-arabinosyltransferase